LPRRRGDRCHEKSVDRNFCNAKHFEPISRSHDCTMFWLTNYAFTEAYKTDTLAILFRSMEILSRYPKQVMVLKGTLVVGGLSGRSAQLQNRLIDKKGTRGFSDFCRDLIAAQRGNRAFQAELLYKARAARDQMDRIAINAPEFGPVLEGITDLFTDKSKKFSAPDRRIPKRWVKKWSVIFA
jgi:hypothetical protein